MKIEKVRTRTYINNIQHGQVIYMLVGSIKSIKYFKWGENIGIDIWYKNKKENIKEEIQYYL
jgi:antitoxin component YwqK of YwqJK toxin-antitoxin module